MKKYKVEFIQTETFIVDVIAENEEKAQELAQQRFDNGDYQETGDVSVGFGTVYDVTNTDDPFNP